MNTCNKGIYRLTIADVIDLRQQVIKYSSDCCHKTTPAAYQE
ncbi:hypothetical protein HMPREF9419_1478 [Prevotella nigrescens ATCC 33563]|nr:hypothetical protein HMPREF9419_1478 [Prevotella nigrescens ATCC 33563]